MVRTLEVIQKTTIKKPEIKSVKEYEVICIEEGQEDIEDDQSSDESDFDDEYEIEEDPKNVSEDQKSRIKFKCKAEDFKIARNKKKQVFKKGSTFNIDGVKIKVLDDP